MFFGSAQKKALLLEMEEIPEMVVEHWKDESDPIGVALLGAEYTQDSEGKCYYILGIIYEKHD